MTSPRDPHWLVKDFHVLYRAAEATIGTETAAEDNQAREWLSLQLTRLSAAFDACDAERLSLRTPPDAASLGGPSLAQLVAAQNAIASMHLGPRLAAPITPDHIATIAYALAVLSAERLAAGERLDSEEEA